MQDLLEKQQKLFGLVLSPTRELAVQIARQFEALGSVIGVQVAVIVGGVGAHASTRFLLIDLFQTPWRSPSC